MPTSSSDRKYENACYLPGTYHQPEQRPLINDTMVPRFIGRRKTMRQQCHSSIIMLRASRAYVPYLPWYIGTSYRKQFGHIPGYSMLHTNSSKAAGPTTSPLCVADAVHIRDVLSYFRYLSSPKLRAEITAVRATASAGCCLLCAARLRTQQ